MKRLSAEWRYQLGCVVENSICIEQKETADQEGPRRRKPAALLHKRQEDVRRVCVAGQQHVREGEVLS